MEIIKLKTTFLIAVVTLSLDGFAQPGDLSLPINPIKKTFNEIYYSSSFKSVLLLNGINVKPSVLEKLDASQILSVKGMDDSVLLRPLLPGKVVRFIEISTVDNEVLKYINRKTNYWTRKFPYSVYIINKEIISYDDQFDKLRGLAIDDIKNIEVFDPENGKKQFGKVGKDGVIAITI